VALSIAGRSYREYIPKGPGLPPKVSAGRLVARSSNDQVYEVRGVDVDAALLLCSRNGTQTLLQHRKYTTENALDGAVVTPGKTKCP
jgi:hypothetical protein